MPDDGSIDATTSLIAHTKGDPQAAERLTVALYRELRRIAGSLMRQERLDHTLEPTAVVHEAYMRLIDIRRVDWQNTAHFRHMAAKTMRRVLADHARKHESRKRGGGLACVTLEENLALTPGQSIEVLALDQALEKLARRHPRQAQVAEMRLFAGLLAKETAHVLKISERTVTDDWQFARAWLRRALGSVSDDP